MLPFVKQSHVRAELHIPMGCFELITLMPCTCHHEREAMAYITLNVSACECCLLLSRADRKELVYV